MPRVANAGENVNKWCDATSQGSSTHDVCKRCFDKQNFSKLFVYNGDPKGDEWELIDAPDSYDALDGYKCCQCKKKLTAQDD